MADVHQELERQLADFLGTESAIIYSQGYSTAMSAIPAFAKRGDVLVADENVCFPIQKGLQISRSNLRYFKHNDVADLRRILKEIDAEQKVRAPSLSS